MKGGSPFVVERLGHDGDGCITTERGPTFVRGALPRETVEIGAVRRDGSVWRAELVRVVSASPERIDALCPIAARCGGCPLITATPALELAEKAAQVSRAFGAAGLRPVIQSVAPEPIHGYRVRARLGFDARRGRRILGYRAALRGELVDVERCVVLEPRLDAALGALRATLAPTLSGSGEIHLGLGAWGAVASITSDDAQKASAFTTLAALVERGTLGGAAIAVGGTTVATRYGEPTEVAHDVDRRALEVPLGGFRQAHEAASAVLGSTVLEWLGLGAGHRTTATGPSESAAGPSHGGTTAAAPRVLELFAGHGNFTLPLAARAGSVVAVERNEEASRALARNLATHGLRADVITLDAAEALATRRRALAGVDLVVLDPPRAGARDCVAPIAALAPRMIVYVSCDPRTLARDAAAFALLGYDVDRVRAVNCFPRTAHVEVVALLVPRAAHPAR